MIRDECTDEIIPALETIRATSPEGESLHQYGSMTGREGNQQWGSVTCVQRFVQRTAYQPSITQANNEQLSIYQRRQQHREHRN